MMGGKGSAPVSPIGRSIGVCLSNRSDTVMFELFTRTATGWRVLKLSSKFSTFR